jgi:hypothetical protein
MLFSNSQLGRVSFAVYVTLMQSKFLRLLLFLSLLSAFISFTPRTAIAGPTLKLAVVEGYGERRATYSYVVKGDSLTQKKKISDETLGLQQFTKNHLVYYDGLGYDSGIFRIGKSQNVGEDIWYSERIAIGIIGGSAYYRTAIVNGERMTGFRKNLKTGDVTDIPELSLKGGNEEYYWYDEMSAPRNAKALYIGATHYIPSSDEYSYQDDRHAGFQIFRQTASKITKWKYIKYKDSSEYVLDFCVSPSGKRIAYSMFASSNSWRKKLIVKDLATGKSWSKQGEWRLSGSCFYDDDTLFVGDQESGIFRMTTIKGKASWKKLKGKVTYPYGEVAVSQ